MLQGIQKRKVKMKENLTSSKAKKISRATKTTKTKVRSLVILLEILKLMIKMKWYVLLLKMI